VGRINRAIELLEQKQPVYYVAPRLNGFVDGVEEYTYEEGVRAAQTWGDIVLVVMEHWPYDVTRLSQFMKGLVDGGPTPSGHRTPTVLVETPFSGYDRATVRANGWVVNQILATGVHGLLLCHADQPDAVEEFVAACRYPFYRAGVGRGLEVGRRGSGGQDLAGRIWGVPSQEYLERADVWPLNPAGELLLGIKIENERGLANAEANARVPGVAFVEWAPLDMSFSLGELGGNLPPYPPRMEESRRRVRDAALAAGAFYTGQVRDETVIRFLDEGTMIAIAQDPRVAEKGRRHSGRAQPA
jgi:4-hydroxy-2-oxoheptanedioate aldolase